MEDSDGLLVYGLWLIVYGLWKAVLRLNAQQSHNRSAGRKAPPCEKTEN